VHNPENAPARQRNTVRVTRATAPCSALSSRKSSAGDKEQAQSAYNSAVAVIDKTANKGLIHKNKAARQKSRLNARIRAM